MGRILQYTAKIVVTLGVTQKGKKDSSKLLLNRHKMKAAIYMEGVLTNPDPVSK